MAVNKGTTITGYVFPNPPAEWSLEEKRFALALRGLFDTLFQKTRGLQADYDKGSYNSLLNKPSIASHILTGNMSLSELGIAAESELDEKYTKPETGIPASDLASGVIPDISGKQDAPATAGTSGQVLGLDSSLQPVWINPGGGVTYSLSISGNVITLTGSDGSTSPVTLPVYNGGISP